MMNQARLVSLAAAVAVFSFLIAACDKNEAEKAGVATEAPTATSTAAVTTGVEPSPSIVPSDNPESNEPYTVLAENLNIPWVIEFDGDTVYISEREGAIVKLEGGVMERQSVQLNKSVRHRGEGGFLGLLLSPDFHTSKLAYAYHTYEEQGSLMNRIVLIKQEGEKWTEVRALLEGIPGASNHDGGRMAIGPGGMLYVTTGDAQQPQLAQDRSSLAGKILRLTLDGKVPADNPFANSYVYSYGHRNPQGLAWDDKGVLFNTEHGPSGDPGGHDEVNRIEAGGNYGWPTVYGDDNRKGMIAPLYHTGEEAIAPSGAMMDESNRLLIATLRGEALYRYDTVAGKMEKVFTGEGRLRDVKIHDGRIYVITNNTDGRGIPSNTDDRLLIINNVK